MDLRSSLKGMNPGHKITRVNEVFDFLSGYHTNLIRKLTYIGLTEGLNVVRKSQKWVISQNCEIAKRLYYYWNCRQDGRSFMYNVKRSGPRILP